MTSTKLNKLLMALLIGLCCQNLQASCAFDGMPQLLQDDKEEWHLVWENQRKEVLLGEWQEAEGPLLTYRNWIRSHPESIDAFDILRTDIQRVPHRHWARNFDVILQGEAGKIRKLSCVEALLFDAHLSRSTIERNPYEFVALIFSKKVKHEEKLKVYFLSGKKDGVGPGWDQLVQQVKNDIAHGWHLLSHVHNHPFRFDSYNIGGALVPSGDKGVADISVFLNLKKHFDLQEAWISNGLDTLVLNSNEFELF